MTYTLLFITSVYTLMMLVIALDFLERRELREEYDRVIGARSKLLYLHIFKLLCEMAVIWLIVSFIGQILMGWIKL